MANSAGSKKRARQAIKRRAHNGSLRSMVRTYLKKVDAAIEAGNKEEAQAAYSVAVSKLDKAADKGLYHKNKAARHKSRLNAKIKALA
ncbi:30S ribosomal protein S20 [Marinomonas ostreistagni]|uniref:30S ribosomal protein S20 n=1 Tax=Marinomonas ostreistagni TaxID=359209 RepID=UPI00194FEA29|nr:30S ribosomal protein S20 [Marinomonas ostreistagni]